MSNQEKTFGEILVGKSFNPSADSKVDRVKELCAELADILHDEMVDIAGQETEENPAVVYLREQIFRQAIAETLNAQMNAVKFLTFKYVKS